MVTTTPQDFSATFAGSMLKSVPTVTRLNRNLVRIAGYASKSSFSFRSKRNYYLPGGEDEN
jgi:hypothetical protein